MMKEGQLKKRMFRLLDYINKNFEEAYTTPATLKHVFKSLKETYSLILNEVKKELVVGSHLSWVSPVEPKETIKYICIEYDRWIEWFGETKKENEER